jgi:hypothetical protein
VIAYSEAVANREDFVPLRALVEAGQCDNLTTHGHPTVVVKQIAFERRPEFT